MTDWRGQKYGVGSVVVYPAQSGRSLTMVEGVVEKITPAMESYYHCDKEGCYKTHYRPVPNRYVVHIRRTRGARWEVGGTEEKNWNPEHYKPELSKIRNTENITVVPLVVPSAP